MGLRDGDGVLDKSLALEANTDKALEVAFELLHQDNPDKDVVRMQSMRASVVKTVLNTQLRVDDQRLRRKSADVLPKLLEAMEAHRARLALEEA